MIRAKPLTRYLQAIYEQNFSHSRDDRGRLVFHIQIEADLQEERSVTVIEQAIRAFRPQLDITTNLTGPVKTRGRGRAGHNSGNGRSRASKQLVQMRQNSPSHPNTRAIGCCDGLGNMSEVKSALPDPQTDSPPLLQEHNLRLQYLLPIELTAILDSGYPLEQPPLLQMSSPWLSPNLKKSLLARMQPC